ncbi:hypothetical protein AB0H77_40635 [Streptomyces sp. NPDC050844]
MAYGRYAVEAACTAACFYRVQPYVLSRLPQRRSSRPPAWER